MCTCKRNGFLRQFEISNEFEFTWSLSKRALKNETSLTLEASSKAHPKLEVFAKIVKGF